jgi:chorismate dehydratase
VTPLRLGAVCYLNARPLVYGLAGHPHRFSVRFDPPATCAALLRDGAIDLGLVPSVEYARGDHYRIVPGVAIASKGPVASVAVFTRRPLASVRTVALDASSRTSVALFQILCARHYAIAPSLVPMAPEPEAMLARCDAALLIGDTALFWDHAAAGVEKLDLGEAWTAMTGLPFVWAAWVGRAGAAGAADVAALQAARDAGVAHADAVADAYAAGDARRAAVGRAYLRRNMRYDLDDETRAGLETFLALAAELGLAPGGRPVRFY